MEIIVKSDDVLMIDVEQFKKMINMFFSTDFNATIKNKNTLEIIFSDR